MFMHVISHLPGNNPQVCHARNYTKHSNHSVNSNKTISPPIISLFSTAKSVSNFDHGARFVAHRTSTPKPDVRYVAPWMSQLCTSVPIQDISARFCPEIGDMSSRILPWSETPEIERLLGVLQSVGGFR
jgi:hypothetical protein